MSISQTKKIKKEKNKLIIEFDYNPSLVSIIKNFTGKKFIAKDKTWSVPLVHVKAVLEKLLPLGFVAEDDVLDEYTKANKLINDIERIHKGEITDEERERIESSGLPLFNYQKIGTTFLDSSKSALMGDEAGGGKTLQVISLADINNAKKILVICISSIKKQWAEEVEKWLPEKKSVVIDGTRAKREKLWREDADFYILNYELVLRDIDLINEYEWDYLFADEATKISNPKSKISKTIKKINAKHIIPMTGTPFNNSIQDIWNIIDLCKPGYLGTYWEFLERYCIRGPFGWSNIVGYKNLAELKEKLKYVMIRRLKKEVLDELPDKLYENIYIDFSKSEQEIYKAVQEEIADDLKKYELEDLKTSNALTKLVRLMQVTDSLNLISDIQESSKLNALKEILETIIHGDSKAIIFSRFKEMTYLLLSELSQYNPEIINGDTPTDDRKKNIDRFMTDENCKLMIMSEAGGMGINLQKASFVIHYDLPWSISKLDQREGRAHRIGQKSNVTVYKLIVSGSIDEYVLKVLHKKQSISEDILGDKDKIYKTKISKKDIDNILS